MILCTVATERGKVSRPLNEKKVLSMAINLMDMVKTAISSGVADQIGSAVGLDKSKTGSAIEAAIPVLLGGLVKKASSPSGLSELGDIFKQQDKEPSVLDNLGGLLSGGANSKLLGMGASLLPMLLGSSQSSIVSVLMKLLGLGDKSVIGLLGSLAPIVMGVVGKQAKSAGGFDPSVLTNLLGSQSNLLSSALPSELKGVMGLADLGKQVSNAASNAASSAARTAQEAVKPESSPLGWLLGLAGLAAAAFLVWNFMSPKAEVKNEAAAGASQQTVPPADAPVPSVKELFELPGGISMDDLKKKLDGSFGGVVSALEGITDVDTAKGAIGKLEEAAKGYTESMTGVPDAAKGVLGPFFAPYLKSVGGILEKLYAIPGVKEIIEPVIGPMVESVSKIAG